MERIVVVFDFDKTIVECDSDNWVVDELGATDLFNQLQPTMPWNSLMDRMMKELYEQGKTIQDIVKVLKRIPIHPRVVPAIKAAYAHGCDLRIVSDANLFFVETILEHLGVIECFTKIYTNPSFVVDEGRLQIFPFHLNKSCPCPHGWNFCPPNMCKGVIVQSIKASVKAEGNDTRFIYLGDGVGDYCSSLVLEWDDFVMPRKNFPVWDLISKNRQLIRAQIEGWRDGEELDKILLSLIHSIRIEEDQYYCCSARSC